MTAMFSYYEVVQVKTDRPALRSVDGCSGAILGMAQNDAGAWMYSVHILGQEEVWSLRESELAATGRFMRREDFYQGNKISVEVDEGTREGRIKDVRGFDN